MPTCFKSPDVRQRARQFLLSCTLSEHQRIRLRRAANIFQAFLEAQPTPWPDDAELLHRWVCAYLVDHAIPTTIAMLHYLGLVLDGCDPHPIHVWRTRLGSAPMNAALVAFKPPPVAPEARFLSGLADHFEAFLAYRTRLNRASCLLARDLRRFDRYLNGRQVHAIAAVDIPVLRDYRATLQALALDTQSGCLRAVHQFLRFMGRNGHTDVTGDGIITMRTGTLRPKIAYIYTLKELATLLLAVKDPGDWNAVTVFTMLHLNYAAGLRISEPIRLRIQDVDLTAGILWIEKSKFGKSRRIPVGDRALHYLRQYAAARRRRFGPVSPEQPFFVNRQGSRMTICSVHLEFYRARRDTGLLTKVPPPRVHDLRHSFAVHRVHQWYAAGENPQNKLVLLSIYMGHREVTYTAHYLQLTADLLRQGGAGFQKLFEGLSPDSNGV
jgi:integrase/recombinase XerD